MGRGTRATGGLGLGLALVKRSVDADAAHDVVVREMGVGGPELKVTVDGGDDLIHEAYRPLTTWPACSWLLTCSKVALSACS